jgi:hypothetical protein
MSCVLQDYVSVFFSTIRSTVLINLAMRTLTGKVCISFKPRNIRTILIVSRSQTGWWESHCSWFVVSGKERTSHDQVLIPLHLLLDLR